MKNFNPVKRASQLRWSTISALHNSAGTAILASTILLIIWATLTPFNFTGEEFSFRGGFAGFAKSPSNLNDLIGNVFLFIPFGISVAASLKQFRIRKPVMLAIALALSALFSFSVETLQLFLESRSSSWIDVITNTTGGGVGVLIYWAWCAVITPRSESIAQFVRRRVSIKLLAALFIGWVIFSGFACLGLQQTTRLSNWDPTFPLILGNEGTRDRPWQGSVSQLEISDRAFSDAEIAEAFKAQGVLPQASLVATYSIAGPGSYPDRAGNLPPLVWQGPSPQSTNGSISAKHWLSTRQPATTLTQRLARSSAFTINLNVATGRLTQRGPARIVSLSSDPLHRNLTIGQDKQFLVIRLRTPITGTNGNLTSLAVPGVFQDTEPHQVIISYQHKVLRVYVDRADKTYSLDFTPEVTLFRNLFPFESRVIPSDLNISLYTFMFYSLFFAPIGLILALIAVLTKASSNFYLVLIGAGIVIPAILIELLMQRGYLKIENLAVSIAIALVTMLLARKQLTHWLRQ